MSDIHFECPSCQQPIAAPGELANQLIDCPGCGQTIEVPPKSAARASSAPPVIPAAPAPVVAIQPRHSVFYYVFWGTLSLIATLLILGLGITFFSGALGGLLLATAPASRPPAKMAPAPERPKTPPLLLHKWRFTSKESSRICTVEGEVSNVSDEPIQALQVVVTYRTKDGSFITSDFSYVEFLPLMPGQKSPWKVMSRWNPEMETASVRFKTTRSGEITYKNEE